METKDYLAYVVKQIHTTIVATVDDGFHSCPHNHNQSPSHMPSGRILAIAIN